MDFFGAIVNGILTTVAYVVIFFGVYKLYQIATDIREIKELVVSGRRAPVPSAPFAPLGAPALSARNCDESVAARIPPRLMPSTCCAP